MFLIHHIDTKFFQTTNIHLIFPWVPTRLNPFWDQIKEIPSLVCELCHIQSLSLEIVGFRRKSLWVILVSITFSCLRVYLKWWLDYFLFKKPCQNPSPPLMGPLRTPGSILPLVNMYDSHVMWKRLDVKHLLMWFSAEHLLKCLWVICRILHHLFTFIFLFQLNFVPSLTFTSCCEIVHHTKTCTRVQRLLPSTLYGKNDIWFLHKMLQ